MCHPDLIGTMGVGGNYCCSLFSEMLHVDQSISLSMSSSWVMWLSKVVQN